METRNTLIEQIFSHRSVRQFDPDHVIPDIDIKQIVRAGQQASTSCSGQMYTIIEISKEDRNMIMPLCGNQDFVRQASFFAIICVDAYRLRQIVEKSGGENQDWEMASLMIGIFDAGLMAQNMVLAAESMGYDICFCGSCGDKPEKMVSQLELPEHVMPLTGIAIGKGTEDPPSRPRLPTDLILHKDRYHPYDSGKIEDGIQHMHDRLVEEGYYQKYSDRGPDFGWRDHMAGKFGGKWLNMVEKRRIKVLKQQKFLDNILAD